MKLHSNTTDFTASFWQKRFLLTDSRQLIHASSTIFFAIKGERHDGHRFITGLYQKGVRNFVIEVPMEHGEFPDAEIILTESTVALMQALVAWHRSKYSLPVISITGSNGKTIVKEWLFELLQSDYSVVKSPKSYNSQIGVPLSVWELQEAHDLAIFEAGISQVGEMEKLEEVIQPSIGIFTNIGTAHQEGFSSHTEKIREKIKLFKNCQTLIFCADESRIYQEASKLNCQLLTWGFADEATLQILGVSQSEGKSNYKLSFQGKQFEIILPFTDKASCENAMHCVLFMLHLSYEFSQIQERLYRLRNVPMRLELKQGINQCLVVNDAYNNDLGGLSVALDFLVQQDEAKTRTVILSDLLEAGADSEKVYEEVNLLLKGKNVQRLIGIGEEIEKYGEAFESLDCQFYKTAKSFLNNPPSLVNESVLVKGARDYHFEQITQYLQQKVHGTRLEVNLDALQHNLNFYKSLLKPETKIMVMVKAFAYGSGSYEVARLLQYNRVDYLAVAYTDEGVELREKGIQLPIMVMNPSPETFGKLVEHKLEPELYNERIFRSFGDFVQSKELTQFPVHIKFDTGMRRLGFEQKDLGKLEELCSVYPALEIVSGFTHLAGSDGDEHQVFSLGQLESFHLAVNELETFLGKNIIKHALNSPGITRFPDWQFDMVRLGIGLYGIDANGIFQSQLRHVATLKTTISQVREITKGETVGYSRKGVAEQNSTIGVISIGYADGFDRRFSNGLGKVLVNGKLAPVIGNVCMDMTMIDLTETGAKEGDEVIVFGETPHISELAQSVGTIPYEILTNVSQRVKRVFYAE